MPAVIPSSPVSIPNVVVLPAPFKENVLTNQIVLSIIYNKQKYCKYENEKFSFKMKLSEIQKQPPEVFCKNTILKNIAIFAGKHLCWSLVFNKVEKIVKMRLQHRCFSVNIVKFLRTPFLKNICKWLFLKIQFCWNTIIC